MGLVPLGCKAFFLEEMFDDFEDFITGGTSTAAIINKISVSAETGNNVVNGEVKEGESKSNIYVKNIINGTEIEPVDIESEASEVGVKEEIEVKENKAFVQREIEIDSEKTEESYELDLEETKAADESFGTAQDEPFGTAQGEPFGTAQDETENIENNSTENKTVLPSAPVVFKSWWLGFIGGLHSFFQKIFNIF